MIHNVNREAVDRMIHHFTQATSGQNVADVLIATAEFTGRAIVATADTPVSGTQLAEVMENHIKDTLIAGYSAKGFSMHGLGLGN
jgi:hypothetical protein